jgi:hypothetical protein
MPSIIYIILEGKWIFNSGASYHIMKIKAFLKDCSLRQTKYKETKMPYPRRRLRKGNFPSQVGNAEYF